jgi:hypothetical protein
MNTKYQVNKKLPGQTLVIFVVMLVVLLAVSMLVIDGGMFLLNRRAAQAAADAAAMAGVTQLCGTGDENAARTIATDYATVKNTATNALITFPVDADGIKGIQVTANIQQAPFFMQLFGINNLNVPASASAKCCSPSILKHVLPVGWFCKDPASGPSDSLTCAVKRLDYKTELPTLKTNIAADPTYIDTNYIYIFMDSIDANAICQSEGGPLDCDIDNDGKNDVQGASDRDWLDLDGGGGSLDHDWIISGYDQPLRIFTWIPRQSGVVASIYDLVNAHMVGRINALPVFNTFCNIKSGVFDPAACEPSAGPSEIVNTIPDRVNGSLMNERYYHVIEYAYIYITCSKKVQSDYCPGAAWAAANDPADSFDDKTRTVEGYFVKGYSVVDGSGQCTGGDLGGYIRSLNK